MIKEKVIAAVLVQNNSPLALMELTLPSSLSFGQVLVKVLYSGICGAQINEIDGAKGPDKFLPHLLGHEGCGEVVSVGAGVFRVKRGDRVVMHWRQSAGLQSQTPKYTVGKQTVNAGWVTTFNNYAIISENRLTPIPSDFNPRIAPLFGCAVTTAFGIVNNDARVKVGQSVVVYGAGGVGINTVQACAMVSAYPIIAVDRVESKLELAREFGATHCLNSEKIADIESAILDILGSTGANVIIETTGIPSLIEQAYRMTSDSGKTILVGVPRKGNNVSIYTLPLHFDKVLTGSHGGSADPDIDIPRYVRLMGANRLRLDGLVTHEFTLENVNEAIELVREGSAGRVLLKMPHSDSH